MTAYLTMGVEHPDRSEHVRPLLAYLGRCSRVKWQAGDLRSVCAFLDAITKHAAFSNQARLLAKLIAKGLKKFPEDPMFHVMAGEREIARGPERCNRRYAQRCFERALELAKRSADPDAAGAVERAKTCLAFLDAVGLDSDVGYGDIDEDDYEEDEYDDDPFGGAPPGGRLDPELDPFADVLPGTLLGMFVEACESMGLDPEETLNDMAGELPFRVPVSGFQSRGKRKKKKR